MDRVERRAPVGRREVVLLRRELLEPLGGLVVLDLHLDAGLRQLRPQHLGRADLRGDLRLAGEGDLEVLLTGLLQQRLRLVDVRARRRTGSSPVCQGFGGETASVAATAVPNQTRLTISSRSISQAMACRTRGSLNGGFEQLNMTMSGRYGLPGDEVMSLELSSSLDALCGHALDPVELTGLEAGQPDALVADRPEDDLVEVRLAGA